MITDELIDRMAEKCILTDAHFDAVVLSVRPARIQTVALHDLALASRFDDVARTIASADYITADGWPMVSLLRWRGIDPSKVSTSHFFERMLADGRFRGRNAAILGPDRAAGDVLRGRLHEAGLHVVQREHGDIDDKNPKQLAKKLRNREVDLLIVAGAGAFGDIVGDQVRRAGFRGVVINIGGAVEGSTVAKRRRVSCVPVFIRWVLPHFWRRPRA